MQKNKKPPIPIDPRADKQPTVIKGTIDPPTKK